MPFLQSEHLVKKYGALTALDDFSLGVEAGTIFALVGPDGAGKTTMIRIVCRRRTLRQNSAFLVPYCCNRVLW